MVRIFTSYDYYLDGASVNGSLPIGMETTVTRDADILYAPVGAEEGVMMSVEKGLYYGWTR